MPLDYAAINADPQWKNKPLSKDLFQATGDADWEDQYKGYQATLAPDKQDAAYAPQQPAQAQPPVAGLGSLMGTPTGGGDTYVGFDLPGSAEAMGQLRGLQSGAISGLSSLMGMDTEAKRKALEDAMFASSSEGINQAAEDRRRAMIEGTFGRGVGSSSITLELADRLAKEHDKALASASREAFINSGDQMRADMASKLGLLSSMFGAGTTGLQAEANVGLANAGRLQQAGQFGQSLGLQQQQLGQQESQFGRSLAQQGQQFQQTNALQQRQLDVAMQQFQQNLAFQQQQLQQQAAQFGRTLTFQEQQNALNRALQQTMQQTGIDAVALQNELNRQQQQGQFDANMAFTGTQNQLNRDQNMQQYNMGNQLARDQMAQQNTQFGQTLDYNTVQSTLDRAMRDAQYRMGLGQQADLANNQALINATGLGLYGLASLFGPGGSQPQPNGSALSSWLQGLFG